ncbi:TetR/AcrR family transcriptional regulator [Salinicola rhizosphaerae]|uniref:TetR family transcriptional regulator n=1 Tax=Salinicola rhizosphaerae TaxID=1443141 RepID=A0ABQ3DZT8_9GAMM|nr:TetR/AcrR family transcriptional regulator [Salinicola rhizosphaerae]GHB20986.1 TetR family transcriptional regulator [Salinicola rhizosphaerae]
MRADAQKNRDTLLASARALFFEQEQEASLRDVARRAGVGMGTLYRHFPTREALLETLLRAEFDALALSAETLNDAARPDLGLVQWLEEIIDFTYRHRGIIAPMMGAIEDEYSALHESCVALRAAGARLLSRAQQAGSARADMTGEELFDLIAALAWLREQPAHAPRAERVFQIVTDVILTGRE